MATPDGFAVSVRAGDGDHSTVGGAPMALDRAHGVWRLPSVIAPGVEDYVVFGVVVDVPPGAAEGPAECTLTFSFQVA